MYRTAKLFAWIEITYTVMIFMVIYLLVALGIYRPSNEISWLELRCLIELLVIGYIWEKFSPYHFHWIILQYGFSCTSKQARRAQKWYRAAQKQAQRKKDNGAYLWKIFIIVIIVTMLLSSLVGWLHKTYPDNDLWYALGHTWLQYWYLAILPQAYNHIPAFRLLNEHEQRAQKRVQAA